MSVRKVQIMADRHLRKALDEAIEPLETISKRRQTDDDDRLFYSLLVEEEEIQNVIDAIEPHIGRLTGANLIVLPVDVSLPLRDAPDTRPESEKEAAKKNKQAKYSGRSREELYEEAAKGANLDRNYMLLVAFSTIVAAVAMLYDNVAALVGAMVIAPLLGPNLALALAVTLGDVKLMGRSAKTLATGLSIAALISIIIGYFWPTVPDAAELMLRSKLGYDSVALGLASGAAATLSLTAGMSNVLIGVMVAVALLPPISAFGIFFGAGQMIEAFDALVLTFTNIVCINLAAKGMLWMAGIGPKKWYEKQRAKKATRRSAIAWLILLAVLIYVIFARTHVMP